MEKFFNLIFTLRQASQQKELNLEYLIYQYKK